MAKGCLVEPEKCATDNNLGGATVMTAGIVIWVGRRKVTRGRVENARDRLVDEARNVRVSRLGKATISRFRDDNNTEG